MLLPALAITAGSVLVALIYGLIAAVLVYVVGVYLLHAPRARDVAIGVGALVFLLALLGGVSG
jgi:hypothetical protein